jgi:hypothetical protein
MNFLDAWKTVVHLSPLELAVVSLLIGVALVGAITAIAMYARLGIDELRTKRDRRVRRRAWIAAHSRQRSAERAD